MFIPCDLYPPEELRIRDSETIDDFLKRIETEVTITLFYVSKVAAINPSHQGKPILRKPMLLTKLLDTQTDFVSYISLLHKRMLLTVVF